MCVKYATYQRLQGEEILKKQEQIKKKRAELLQVKTAKENLLKEREDEKQKLEDQEKQKREMVANLQKKQKGLQSEINKKRREANQLNARIDKLIAEEIERARKRAAEEARREAAARKKSEAKEGKSTSASPGTETKKKAEPLEAYSMSKRTVSYPVTLSVIVVSFLCRFRALILLPVIMDNMQLRGYAMLNLIIRVLIFKESPVPRLVLFLRVKLRLFSNSMGCSMY